VRSTSQYYLRDQRRGKADLLSEPSVLLIPHVLTDRRDRRDESARYHPYRASTADQNAIPTILEKLEDIEYIGSSQPVEVDQAETWDEAMLDPFADWTAFLASRPFTSWI
jgi:hypothetical protein